MKELSILIPARNEMFLSRTIEDIISNIEADTEIIVVLDGAWAEPAIPQHERVTVVYLPESIGQRAATNLAAKLSNAKYLMKVDAHCAFDKGFDRKMITEMKDDITMIPIMRNLHAFDWVCPEGHRRYQGPSGVCKECGKETTRDIVWIPKTNPQSKAYCFDSEPHFQYTKTKEKGDLTETMSIQGSCFMVTREKYWELNLSDEAFGSWGSQGIEVACKTWLSGGRVLVNHKTWYAHLFRTQGGDFSFPYEQSGNQVERAKRYARELFFEGKWNKATRPLSWLVEKFWPVKGWTEEDLNKLKKKPTAGVVYISDVRIDPGLLKKCQEQLRKAFKGKIVSVTLKPIDFGENIVLPLKREKVSIFKQILAGLEALDTDYVFLCDDDCLYDPSHFDFIPPRKDTFYYDLNWWRVRTTDGFSVHWDGKQSNLLCADRKLLVAEYRERVRKVEAEGWHKGGFEPGTRSLKRGGFSDSPSATYWAKEPSLDLRHGMNLTGDKWKKEDFRDPRYSIGWGERYDKSWKETILSNI
jgi:glycosyltransferase involved in cell wall biosynthesis